MREKIIIFVLLSFIFLNFSDTFGNGRCIHTHDLGTRDYTTEQLPSHTCKKEGSNFCYFPASDNTLALYHNVIPYGHTYDLSDTYLFSSKFGGCTLNIGYPQDRIWATFKSYEAVEFIKACGRSDYFSTKMDITYGAYDKGNLIPQTHEKLEDRMIPLDGYRLNGKIREFKSGVEGVNKYIYNSYNREIYTLRVIKAEITDDKCPPPKDILENKPISVATKLLLELKLNADDRIVYDDKETKKIEVNADQDEFYFGGTLIF